MYNNNMMKILKMTRRVTSHTHTTEECKEEEKKTEQKPPIGECQIASIYWQKGSRALQKSLAWGRPQGHPEPSWQVAGS